MRRFSAKDPEETVYLSFDFTAELGTENIAGTPEVAVSLYLGEDEDPEAILDGDAVATTSKIVAQKVAGGVHGAQYRFQAQVETTAGRTLVLVGVLPVKTAPPVIA